jgi:hypothetical protein
MCIIKVIGKGWGWHKMLLLHGEPPTLEMLPKCKYLDSCSSNNGIAFMSYKIV